MRKSGLPAGTIVVAVGFGVRDYDRPKLSDIAGGSRNVIERARVDRVVAIYDDILAGSVSVKVDELTIRDELQSNMSLVAGSADPPTVTITGQLLQWQLSQPSFPLTLGYRVEPLDYGLHPISVKAEASFTDTEQLIGAGTFPTVSVQVRDPTPTWTPTNTPTPTATSTSTPTATPTPGPVFLPITYQNWPVPTPTPSPTVCVPEEQTVDVALVIDTSTSMSDPTEDGGQPKLEAAIEAAEELVKLLKPDDQVTVVGFNRTAHLATQLTSDKARVRYALSTLPGKQAQGTSIDLGLAEALAELQSPRHVDGNHRSIILVTDGHNTGIGGNAAVRAVAQQIHTAGITLITVGLGSDADEALLREIASSPELYFPAPNADELVDIYKEIARYIPCP
jgi:hypothetical protein